MSVALSQVPDALLRPLAFRAAAARESDPLLHDPLAIALAGGLIGRRVARLGPARQFHAIRAQYCDDLIRRFLLRHADGVVVALGEGLETQFWRVGAGAACWISVDAPDAIALRRQLLPLAPRNVTIGAAPLDLSWVERLPPTAPVFVTAAGLPRALRPAETIWLLRSLVRRLPGAEIFLDFLPPWLAPPLPGLDRGDAGQLPALAPGLSILHACAYTEPYPDRVPLLARLVRLNHVRRLAPIFVHGRIETRTVEASP